MDAWAADAIAATGYYPAPQKRAAAPVPAGDPEPAGPDLPELLDPFEVWPELLDANDDALDPDTEPNRNGRPDNRQANRLMGRSRDGLGLVMRRMEPTWHGPIPNVGQSTATYRTGRYVRCPVAVDVVPVIHDRMRRGAQSARWALGVSYVQLDSDSRGVRWTVVKYREGDSPEDLAATCGSTFDATYRVANRRDDGGGGEVFRARSMRQLVRTRPTTAPPQLPP